MYRYDCVTIYCFGVIVVGPRYNFPILREFFDGNFNDVGVGFGGF